MKYCNNCGKEVDDNAVICPSCGCAVASKNVEVDKPSTGLNILSFLIPLVGLILYLSWHENNYSQHENTREDARFILDLVPIVVVTRLVLFCFFPIFFTFLYC